MVTERMFASPTVIQSERKISQNFFMIISAFFEKMSNVLNGRELEHKMVVKNKRGVEDIGVDENPGQCQK